MARQTVYRRQGAAGTVDINMTPMIDCTFQLIIFFILASQMASKSLAQLKLHRPEESQAIPAEQVETPDRLIVNVITSAGDSESANPALAGKADRYEIDGVPIRVGDEDRLTEVFRYRKSKAGNPEEFCVEIRADYRVNFGDVQPIMLATAKAKIVNMNITALTAVGQE